MLGPIVERLNIAIYENILSDIGWELTQKRNKRSFWEVCRTIESTGWAVIFIPYGKF